MTHSSDNLELIVFGWLDAQRRGDVDLIAPRLEPAAVDVQVYPSWRVPLRGEDSHPHPPSGGFDEALDRWRPRR